jgi:hypothetical protein
MARKRTTVKLPPFVALPWMLLNHPAFKKLPPSAAKLLPYFLGKPKLPYNDKDYCSREFSFTYHEGITYGCARKTFSRIIKALIENGFIDPVEKGGLRGDGHSTSKFKLSHRWEAYGTYQFHTVKWEEFGQKQIESKFKNVQQQDYKVNLAEG